MPAEAEWAFPTLAWDRTACGDRERAFAAEWLVADGAGGFASGTIAGLPTRRYHALLLADTPRAGRVHLLAALDAALIEGTRRLELDGHQWVDCWAPRGWELLESFEAIPFPRATWRAGGRLISRTVAPIRGGGTLLRFLLEEGPPALLALRPMLTGRDYHALVHENGVVDGVPRPTDDGWRVPLYPGLPDLHLRLEGEARFLPDRHWWRRACYARERERGLDWQEDLFVPGEWQVALQPGVPLFVSLSANGIPAAPGAALLQTELERRGGLLAAAGAVARNLDGALLVLAADAFLAQRQGRNTLLAGFPWFSDWGRDAMISLPGLLLCTGRFGEAYDVLEAFSGAMDGGIIPNRFPDVGSAPEYNTADATLWLFHAVEQTAAASGQWDRAVALFPRLKASIEAHLNGTHHGIRADSDGLLLQGEPGWQLTWMDARVGNQVITPRMGKAVEIQGLWHRALRAVGSLAERANDSPFAARCRRLASQVRASFAPAFWNEQRGYLADVVRGNEVDLSLRPNQLLALELLDSIRARRALQAVEQSLLAVSAPGEEKGPAGHGGGDPLASVGLRTLAPSDPRYCPRYRGGPAERDGAYHQGTVWPWLVGPWIEARVRLCGDSPEQVRRHLAPLLAFLRGPGLGALPEVFDGDEPRAPGGCFAQAWSVAEVLRVLAQYGMDRMT